MLSPGTKSKLSPDVIRPEKALHVVLGLEILLLASNLMLSKKILSPPPRVEEPRKRISVVLPTVISCVKLSGIASLVE